MAERWKRYILQAMASATAAAPPFGNRAEIFSSEKQKTYDGRFEILLWTVHHNYLPA